MGRTKGTFDFTSSFEMLRSGPLDARIIVQEKSDLFSSSTWSDSNDNIWLYTGIVVSVIDDPLSSNNGLYFLLNDASYGFSESWDKISSSSSDVWNGLSKTDNSIGLGGTLSTDVSIQLFDNKFIIDGSNFQYAKDFSETYTSRSIVDKGYVDNVVGNSIKGYSATFSGDGITTAFEIHHNLGTLSQSITVYEENGLMSYPDLERGENTDVILFHTAPAIGVEYSVVILGFTVTTGKGFVGEIIGNDVSTSFNIEHNLATIAQSITVFDNSTNSIIYPDLKRGSNTDIISFTIPPETGENYSVVIIGF